MSQLDYKNLDQCSSYKKLKAEFCSVDLKKRLTGDRVKTYETIAGPGLKYNYSAKLVDENTLSLLQGLADEQQCLAKFKALFEGQMMNTGEKRKVLHHLVRGQLGTEVVSDGKNLREFYINQQNRIDAFSDKVHSGMIKGSTGKKFATVVQIGIGGSDLGPRALYLALKNLSINGDFPQKMHAFFISNVDPDDANDVISQINPEETLFILVSKSGTTQETLTNQKFVVESMRKKGIPGLDPKQHMIAVTSETSPLAKSPDYLDSFYIDDFIGGRYSATSPVGGAVLALSFGKQVFSQLLSGATEADKLAMGTEITKNASLLDALLGIIERNILGYSSTAVLPYSQALSRFPAHLQQLDMESNGKGVNRDGVRISYSTGPIIFGEPGTNGQHSFYQLLHQGTDIIPLQFVGFIKPQINNDLQEDGSTSQQKLNANLVAQIFAFATGKDDSNLNKHFFGQRPCSLLYADRLTPAILGALLAHYENKVMFQGFLWNLNSFDQEGVQLGKLLTSKVLKKLDLPSALSTLSEKLHI